MWRFRYEKMINGEPVLVTGNAGRDGGRVYAEVDDVIYKGVSVMKLMSDDVLGDLEAQISSDAGDDGIVEIDDD